MEIWVSPTHIHVSTDARDGLEALSTNEPFSYYYVLGLTIVSITLNSETKACASLCTPLPRS